MKRPEFLTTDVLRLEVETQESGVNLIDNPSGDLGGWGWITPVTPSIMLGGYDATAGRVCLQYEAGLGPSYFTSEPAPMGPGQYVRGSWLAVYAFNITAHRARFEFLDLTGAVISSSSQTGDLSTSATVRRSTAGLVAPAGTAAVRLRFDIVGPGFPHGLFLAEVAMSVADTTLGLTAAAIPVTYENVLGQTHNLTISREELNVGTLSAVIRDTALDPSRAESIIQTGRRVRVMARIPATGFDVLDYGEGAYGGAATEWAPIFTGKVARAQVTYDLLQRDETKRSVITLTAVDALSPLAQESRTQGVATIPELPYVLEGCGVPWNVNGATGHLQTAVVVATNDQASAVDQVAVTRDTALGYAWVDRFGVLQVWDAAELADNPRASAGGVSRLDEADYRDVDLDYDTDRCINAVTVRVLVYDPVTAQTEEVSFGPFRDEQSVRLRGLRKAEFTVQGLANAEDDARAYATAILSANATPVVRVNSVRIPVKRLRAVPKALIDLYDEITVANDRAEVEETLRVVGLVHEIATTSWNVTATFAGQNLVAPPQVIPSPSPGGGMTTAELLRPVGEVTMFYGLPSACPAGWLVLNGATYDGDVYPKLEAFLGTTTLPNMIDRVPIGAGTKALGTTGQVGDTGTLGWRALYFIIRAV